MCVFDAVLHCDHNEVPNFHMSWKLKESRSAPLHCRIFLFSLCRKVQWFLSSDQTTLHSAVLILLPEAAVLWRFFILFFKHLFRNVSDPSSGRLKKYISKRWSKPGRLCAQVKLISNADLNVDLKKKKRIQALHFKKLNLLFTGQKRFFVLCRDMWQVLFPV